MGVDISAYRNLEKIDCEFDKNGEPVDEKILNAVEDGDYIKPYKNPSFPCRADDIDNLSVYKYTDKNLFFSASYGGYNKLRDKLAEIAGYPLKEYDDDFGKEKNHCVDCWNGKTGLFSELINFSDCEGIIGTETSNKLLNDFNDFQEKAIATENKFFISFYNNMRSAFKMASNNGLVKFY